MQHISGSFLQYSSNGLLSQKKQNALVRERENVVLSHTTTVFLLLLFLLLRSFASYGSLSDRWDERHQALK